ncbi:MAG: hypothetical protein GXO20_01060, partial [Thermodesulfobacteria bacterium]|nr:hypothetical protein [Thermodesulfobacteriota bacterium]
EKHITIHLTDRAKEWLAEVGYDPVYGARPLKRAIQRYLEDPLAIKILEGTFQEGDHVLVDYDETKGALDFRKHFPEEIPEAEAAN